MLLCVAYNLRRRVEAHRLAVEQRGREDVRIVALHPARNVDEVGKARRVAFGKAVFAEAADLLEASLDKAAFVTAFHHPVDEQVLEILDRPARRKVAIARRRPLASRSVNSAATIAIRIACSWNSGMPSVFRRIACSSSAGPRSGQGDG